ncbi:MAG: 50S ribosomal protein L29 [Mycoplasmataceae bacterium]|jgi:ribosomal protein L29|nr:50S ribosomal protein L29 [Mycoplasmataceae bacterium]
MNKLNKELLNKPNEELAILVFRLKLQLLEIRFKRQSGEFDKQHLVSEIKKTIARVLTILKSREIDITIGTHGITMYDRKGNKVTSLNKQANEVMSETSKSFEKPEDIAKTGKESVVENVESIVKTEENVIKSMPIKNNVAKPAHVENKRKAGPMRKTQGGGQ